MTSMLVDLRDLRDALAAVRPHAAQAKHSAVLSSVRLTPQSHNVEVSATDRYTMALAIVSVLDYDGAHATPIDLSASDIAKITTVFTPTRDEENLVRITTGPETLTITDVSGLINGETLILDRPTPDEGFPELRRAFAGTLRGQHTITGDFWLSAPLLKRFEIAQKTYGHPLIFEPSKSGGSLLVRVGESFLGQVVLTRPDEEAIARAKGWADDWGHRIPAEAEQSVWHELVTSFYTGDTSENDKIRKGDDTLPEDLDVELVVEAATLVITSGFASRSMIGRKMRVGFAMASNLMDRLAALGIVGPSDGSAARDVLYGVEQLHVAVDKIRGAA